MNILVCVKRVPLTGGKITLTEDEQAIQTRHLGFTVSPHEECAVEEAVQITQRSGGTVTVLTLGPPEAADQHAQAGRVEEGHLTQVSQDVRGAVVNELDDAVADLRDGVHVDLARDLEHGTVAAHDEGLQAKRCHLDLRHLRE